MLTLPLPSSQVQFLYRYILILPNLIYITIFSFFFVCELHKFCKDYRLPSQTNILLQDLPLVKTIAIQPASHGLCFAKMQEMGK